MEEGLKVFLYWLPVRELLKTSSLLFTSKVIRQMILSVYGERGLKEYLWRHYGEKMQRALLSRLAMVCYHYASSKKPNPSKLPLSVFPWAETKKTFSIETVVSTQHNLGRQSRLKIQNIVWVTAFFIDPPIGEIVEFRVDANGNTLRVYATICENNYVQFPMLDGRAGLFSGYYLAPFTQLTVSCWGEGKMHLLSKIILTGERVSDSISSDIKMPKMVPFLATHRYSTTLREVPPFRSTRNHNGVYVNAIMTSDGGCILRYHS